jgi:cytochrome c
MGRSVFVGLALTALTASQALAQDVAAGEKAFGVCRTCHQVGPSAKNGIGPALNGVVGRAAGTVPGFNYSDANKNSGIVWDDATLAKYLENPQAVIKGTKMAFPGIHDPQRVASIIAFLKQYGPDGQKTE